MGSTVATRGATPQQASRFVRRGLWNTGLFLGFAITLLGQEHLLLERLNGTVYAAPNPMWRAVWPLLLLSFALLFPARFRFSALGLLGAFSTALLMIDAAFFQFFRTMPSIAMLATVQQIPDVADSVSALTDLSWCLALPVYLTIAILGARLNGPNPAEGSTTGAEILGRFGFCLRAPAATALGAALLALGAAYITPVYERTHHLNRGDWVEPSEHWSSQYSTARHAGTFGVFNYHLRDVISGIADATSAPALEGKPAREVEALVSRRHALNQTPSPLHGIARGRHVILLQMEAWQQLVADRVIDGVEIAPNLNQLRRTGLTWDNLMDVTLVGRTSDAEFAVMAGLLPDVRKAASFHHLDAVAQPLPRLLAGKGYRTVSFHGYYKSFWNRAVAHPSFGIEHMVFQDSFDPAQVRGMGIPDPVVFEAAAQELADAGEERVFALVISLSSHHPFLYTPPAYRQLLPNWTLEAGYGIAGPYLRSVRFADDALGEFLQLSREKGFYENSVFVVYGDHDMGSIGTTEPIEELDYAYGDRLSDRIPLAIAIPGKEEELARHRDTYRHVIGGLHDLYPTILHLLGEEVPRGVLGTHLFVPNEQRDPLALPGLPTSFAHRGALIVGNQVHVLDPQWAGPTPVPDPFGEQSLTQALLDLSPPR